MLAKNVKFRKFWTPKFKQSSVGGLIFLGDVDIGDMFEMLVTDFHSQYEIGPISRKSWPQQEYEKSHEINPKYEPSWF